MTDTVHTHMLTTAAAANLLQVSVSTLLRWTERGLIGAITYPSGHRRFDPVEIEEFRLHLLTPSHTNISAIMKVRNRVLAGAAR